MHGTGARGRIAEAGGHVIELAAALAGDFDRSAAAVAIALVPSEDSPRTTAESGLFLAVQHLAG